MCKLQKYVWSLHQNFDRFHRRSVEHIGSGRHSSTNKYKTVIHSTVSTTAAALMVTALLLFPLSMAAQPPESIVERFTQHMHASADLVKSTPLSHTDREIADSLVECANIADAHVRGVAALANIYHQLDAANANEVRALVLAHLRFVATALPRETETCSMIISRARSPELLAEARALRNDIEECRTYLAQAVERTRR